MTDVDRPLTEGSHEAEVTPQESPTDFDAVVVGAGFAGLYMLHKLRQQGLTVRVYEAGEGPGGTWHWNRYPGARCDVESMEYSYQFDDELQQEWEWSERYATQPEILRYIHHVADRYDLWPDIQFETRVESVRFDEQKGTWAIETDRGDSVRARFCIMATGCLSTRNKPEFSGLDDFEGDVFHTGSWPHEEVGFKGKRVAVIGTGSSAIQAIPIIAEQAEHLYVFQRTANYSVPAHNRPLDPEEVTEVKANYQEIRDRAASTGFGIDLPHNDVSALDATPEEHQRELEARWQKGGFSFLVAYNDIVLEQGANDIAAEFVRDKIRQIVDDPEVAELLCPQQTIGCKRLCLDDNYFATFNRPNVSLVDVSKEPIEGVDESGVRARGEHFEVDSIVLATGFDAMTGALLGIDIRGRKGLSLRDKWAEGPRMYLGLATAGFPNLFAITGPGSPSVLSNMLPSIEQHVNWIADCVEHLNEQDVATIEATQEAEDDWVDHVNEVAGETLFYTCNSWYLGANVPGKPRVFMPYLGFNTYVEKCNEIVANDYQGFHCEPVPVATKMAG